jgi:hypothetical protein
MTDLLGRLLFRAVDHFRVRYRSPTRSWPPGFLRHLSFDMRDRALSGVPLDARLDTLKSFGPADWFRGDEESLELYYYRLGLIVSLWHGDIVSFEILLDPELCPDRSWHPFVAGRLTLLTPAELRRDLTRTTNEREVLGLLGVPTETGPVLGQRVHTFITAGNFIDTYHDPETGRLVRIELSEAGPDSAPAAA